MIRGLASQSWRESWAQSGVPFITAHAGFDLDVFTDPVQHSIAIYVREAIDAGSYRFDASDQMPVEVAFGPLHSALVDYVTHPGASARRFFPRLRLPGLNTRPTTRPARASIAQATAPVELPREASGAHAPKTSDRQGCV